MESGRTNQNIYRWKATLKLCRLMVHLQFYKIYRFESHMTGNDVIIMYYPKQWKQWENADFTGTK